jgi:hypothetical protein
MVVSVCIRGFSVKVSPLAAYVGVPPGFDLPDSPGRQALTGATAGPGTKLLETVAGLFTGIAKALGPAATGTAGRGRNRPRHRQGGLRLYNKVKSSKAT